MKNSELYKIKSEIKVPIMAYIYELAASVGRQCLKTVSDLHLRQRGLRQDTREAVRAGIFLKPSVKGRK